MSSIKQIIKSQSALKKLRKRKSKEKQNIRLLNELETFKTRPKKHKIRISKPRKFIKIQTKQPSNTLLIKNKPKISSILPPRKLIGTSKKFNRKINKISA